MQKVLFIGDSITDMGYYVAIVNSYLNFVRSDDNYVIDNIGLSSENTTGLTEKGHPGKRPYIFNRLDSILKYYDSNVAIVLYGVNEAIYSPFTQENFVLFQDGITKLVQMLKNNGMQVWLCTPTAFDSVSCTSPLSHEEIAPGIGKIYAKYNAVMTVYTEWVKDNMASTADKIIDIHTAMNEHITTQRASDPQYNSGDGIHPNMDMSAVIAHTVLQQGFGMDVDCHKLLKDDNFIKLYNVVYKRQQLLHNLDKSNVIKGKSRNQGIISKHIVKKVAKLDKIINSMSPQ